MVFGIKIIAIGNNITDDSRDQNLSILLLNLFFIFKITKMIIIDGKCDANAIANN